MTRKYIEYLKWVIISYSDYTTTSVFRIRSTGDI